MKVGGQRFAQNKQQWLRSRPNSSPVDVYPPGQRLRLAGRVTCRHNLRPGARVFDDDRGDKIGSL